jgi:transcriptional regulator with XRE-family HTH domain
VSTNLTIRQRLLAKFRSRKRRRTFAEQDLGSTVAAQIYALRQKRDKMTQDELARRTEMSQARISVLENPNYRKVNVRTLQRIAAAFDVALIVRFVSFGELLDWTVTGSQETLAPLSFDEEFPESTQENFAPSNSTESLNLASRFSEALNPSGDPKFKLGKVHKRATVLKLPVPALEREKSTGIFKATTGPSQRNTSKGAHQQQLPLFLIAPAAGTAQTLFKNVCDSGQARASKSLQNGNVRDASNNSIMKKFGVAQ